MDKLHILVVDDNHINRLFFQSSLKKLNCVVTTANNGFEALEACKVNQYDLILMDIRMDGMNGVESASKIKQLQINNKTPIVAISAEFYNTENQNCFAESLLKPVKQDTLAQTIAKHTKCRELFNHATALKISHNDEKIVFHLRKIFTEQLSQLKPDIVNQFNNKEYEILNETLHKLLGSAKICAAEQMVNEIIELKTKYTEAAFNQLLETIEEMINLSG